MKRFKINNADLVVLSRRNLLTLLAKLDGHPPNSACTIGGGTDAPGLFVKAEEDDVHYASREVIGRQDAVGANAPPDRAEAGC